MPPMNHAPVAFFAFNRPEHAAATLEALAGNHGAEHTVVYAFCDGPRPHRGDDIRSVEAVRQVLRRTSGFRDLHVIARAANAGLSASIIGGVSQLVEEYGRVIVVEDDLVTSPFFLRFMNEGLDFYEHKDRVISIHGYIYPVKETLPEAFFLRGADCWGWATWKRGWKLFEPDGRKLLSELGGRGLEREFDMNGARAYVGMLEDQIAGRCDSWAIRWDATAFLRDKLTLYPGVSLVRNIGLDHSGTHCGTAEHLGGGLSDHALDVRVEPIEASVAGRETVERFLRAQSPTLPRSRWSRWWDRARSMLRTSSPP